MSGWSGYRPAHLRTTPPAVRRSTSSPPYGWTLVHLGRKLRRCDRIRAGPSSSTCLLGTALPASGRPTNLVVPLLLGSSRFSRYGPYFTLLVVGFTAHAICRYRLMDIRVVISRYAGLCGRLGADRRELLLGGVVLFSSVVGHDAPLLSPTVTVLLGLCGDRVLRAARSVHAPAGRPVSLPPVYDTRHLVREGSRLMGDPGGSRPGHHSHGRSAGYGAAAREPEPSWSGSASGTAFCRSVARCVDTAGPIPASPTDDATRHSSGSCARTRSRCCGRARRADAHARGGGDRVRRCGSGGPRWRYRSAGRAS